mmetsp:Transcript_23533/g.53705  ORF Transcript_23533/g.53705 Transcript_23533/m.53705 type:complete len:148 (+) Transcript_23533:797-1240(+)
MYVAFDPNETGKIIGFCDVDSRPPRVTPAAPRPYLSDLAVRVDWKRRGVATALIRKCEERSRDIWHRGCLYLRVESANERALRMYEGFDYVVEPHPVFGKGSDTTILLRRDFIEKRQDGDEIPTPREYAAIIEGREKRAGSWSLVER